MSGFVAAMVTLDTPAELQDSRCYLLEPGRPRGSVAREAELAIRPLDQDNGQGGLPAAHDDRAKPFRNARIGMTVSRNAGSLARQRAAQAPSRFDERCTARKVMFIR